MTITSIIPATIKPYEGVVFDRAHILATSDTDWEHSIVRELMDAASMVAALEVHETETNWDDAERRVANDRLCDAQVSIMAYVHRGRGTRWIAGMD